MENFLLKLRIVAEFIIAFGLGYIVFTLSLKPFISTVLGFIAVFILFQALGLIDKLNGYGQYAPHDDDEPDEDYEDVEEPSEPDDDSDSDFILNDDEDL